MILRTSRLLLLSGCCPEYSRGEPPHLFMWSLPQHCLQTMGPWPPGGSRSALLHIILLCSEMAFNLQIFTLQVAGRLMSISCNEGPVTSRPSPVAFVNRLLDFYVSLGLGITIFNINCHFKSWNKYMYRRFSQIEIFYSSVTMQNFRGVSLFLTSFSLAFSKLL